MKSYAIVFQILGLTCRRTDANKWLRAPAPKRVVVGADGQQQEQQQQQQQQQAQRTRYLRIDAVPSQMVVQRSWENEQSEEIILKLDQIANYEAFEEEQEDSIMDAFEIEQIEDPIDENDQSLN